MQGSSSAHIIDALDRTCALTKEQIAELERYVSHFPAAVYPFVLSRRWMSYERLQHILAACFNLPVVDMKQSLPPQDLLEEKARENFHNAGIFPYRTEGERILIALDSPRPDAILHAHRQFGPGVVFVLANRFDMLSQLMPTASIRPSFFNWTYLALFACAGLLAIALITIGRFSPYPVFFTGLILLANSLCVCSVWLTSFCRRHEKLGHSAASGGALNFYLQHMDQSGLPVFSLLCPFTTAQEVEHFTTMWKWPDYPLNKLDLVFLMGRADQGVQSAVRACGLAHLGQIVFVQSHPNTHPAAVLDAAGESARGTYGAIINPLHAMPGDELLRAAAAFALLPPQEGMIHVFREGQSAPAVYRKLEPVRTAARAGSHSNRYRVIARQLTILTRHCAELHESHLIDSSELTYSKHFFSTPFIYGFLLKLLMFLACVWVLVVLGGMFMFPEHCVHIALVLSGLNIFVPASTWICLKLFTALNGNILPKTIKTGA
jgi:hypothetical protein